MKLRICSEREAIRRSQNLEVPTSIISITCPNDPFVEFADNENLISVFRMAFNDIDHDKIPGIPAPEQNDFYGLKRFVDSLHCEELIVHCGAGISRSAGTAAAISDYMNLGYQIFGNQKYEPNRLVYKFACIELGIQERKDENYYNIMFNDVESETKDVSE